MGPSLSLQPVFPAVDDPHCEQSDDDEQDYQANDVGMLAQHVQLPDALAEKQRDDGV